MNLTGLPGGTNPGYVTVHEVLFTDTKDRVPIAAALPEAKRTGGGYQVGVPAGCSRQVSAWREAERHDSVAAYEAYLRDYPAGAHAPEARTRLSDLREQQEWDRALRFNTPEAFQRYLSR